MAQADIRGQEIEIPISEPWDLGEHLSWQALRGRIEAIGEPNPDEHYLTEGPVLLVRLEEPFVYRNQTCEWFVGTPRYGDDDVSTPVQSVHDRVFSFVRIPKERALSNDPLDITWWRGGVSLMGRLRLMGK